MTKTDEMKKAKSQHIESGEKWQDLPSGGLITEPSSSEHYKTGDWRTKRPIWSIEKCTQCMLCWIFCPDSSIKLQDGKVVGINYDHCKGCGICAVECPDRIQAIEMEPEENYRK